jgi:hypothetical protein
MFFFLSLLEHISIQCEHTVDNPRFVVALSKATKTSEITNNC